MAALISYARVSKFERPDNREFTETIMTLAGLSRFVIVELSGPSVPNELRRFP